MRKTQRGVTFLGWIILLLPIAVLIFAAIQLTPIYFRYQEVSKAMNNLATVTPEGGAINVGELRISIEKALDLADLKVPTKQDVNFERVGDEWMATVDYEEVAPLIANVSLLVQFHKQVKL